MFLPGLDHAAIVHHDVLSDAFQLLQARRKIPDELLIGGCEAGISTANMDDFYAWLRILTWTAPGQYRDGDCGGSGRSRSRNGSLSSTSSGKSGSSRAQAVPVTPGNGPGTNLFQITGPAADLAHLPLEATRLNADLVRIYVKLISRFKSCLDGNPDPSNPYTRVYVPYCLQTPLLAQVAIYTSACFLHETGHLDKMVAVTHKGRAIDMLNAQLQGSRRHAFGEDDTRSVPTSDDAITAIIQLVMDEWYWGQTRNLHTHLRGLREMIRLRGGLRNLGMNGLISKLAMVVMHLTAIHSSDLAIALSLEMAPVLQGNSYTRANSGGTSLFDYEDLTQTPFRIAHNTPLVAGQPSFAHCAEPLNIHPTTASILDDMRFLITTVLALPPNPTAKDLQKVQTTAEWIHNRIQLLPEDSPEISDNDNKGIDDIGAVDSAMHVHNDGETLSNKTGIPMERRPSIILSQVEPVYETGSTHNASFLGNSQQHHQPQWQQRQLSASPRSNAGRGHSVSPLRKQPSPTPPGSADSSLLSTSMSANNRSGLPSSEFSSRRGSAQWPQATFGPSAQPSSPEPSLVLDPLYQTVRQTALIYARAVLQRRTFSQVVEPHEFVQLWTATWRVSLTAWKGLLGVFMWVTLSIVASARETPHDLFVKSMLSICTVQMSLESWEVAAGALKAAVRLSTWLGGGREGLESTGSQMKGADSAQSVRAQQPRQYGVSAAGGASGVAGSTTTERLELRDSGATLPGWNS
ncbi:hypothetical protein SEUCBS140593_002411 [Sporothrix eucalyptigena]|uniref:C6 zinc finger domain containing protein n=1 Tax=Sporothrix eucalyptigena TaxID=1812306 RepID=A0ABP0B6Z2_9PEZI